MKAEGLGLFLSIYLAIVGTAYLLMPPLVAGAYPSAAGFRGWIYIASGLALLWSSITDRSLWLRLTSSLIGSAVMVSTAVYYISAGGRGLGHGVLGVCLFLETIFLAAPKYRPRVNLLGFALGMNILLDGAGVLVFGTFLPPIPGIGLRTSTIAFVFVATGLFAAYTNLRPDGPMRVYAHAVAGGFGVVYQIALTVAAAPQLILPNAVTLYRSVVTAFLPSWEKKLANASFLNFGLRFGAAFATVAWTVSVFVAYVMFDSLDRTRSAVEFRTARMVAFWLVIVGALLAGAAGVVIGRRLAGTLHALVGQGKARAGQLGLEELDAVARFAEESAQVRTLHELGGRLMGQHDLGCLLGEILSAAESISGSDKGNIQLLGKTGELRIEAQHGFSPKFLEFFNAVDDHDTSACGAALKTCERVVVEDVERSPVFAGTPALRIMLNAGVRAVQSTPMISRTGALVGMLSTHYSQPHVPSERDLRLIDLLARQAADLIEKFRADEQLRVSNEALRRANEDLKQFAFAASHDLQEPLRMITSYSQLLVKGYRGQLDGEAGVYVNFISSGTKRMRELLADLLAYTQVEAEDHPPDAAVDLNLILRKVTENLGNAIEENNALITSGCLPVVHGHDVQFLQLFQNLLGNAIKYRSRRPPEVHVSAVKEGTTWHLSVADNGIGIDPEFHDRVFGVFKRLHGKNIPGTGMGLAICQRVVKRSGGRIWVESELDKGATFHFTIPAAVSEVLMKSGAQGA